MGFRPVLWGICYFLLSQSVYANSEARLEAHQDLFELKWSFTEFQPEGQKLPSQKPTQYQVEVLDVLAKLIQDQCSACQVQKLPSGQWQVKLPADFEFRIGLNGPLIEFKTLPADVPLINMFKESLQIMIWKNARAIGLQPHTFSRTSVVNAGHFKSCRSYL